MLHAIEVHSNEWQLSVHLAFQSLEHICHSTIPFLHGANEEVWVLFTVSILPSVDWSQTLSLDLNGSGHRSHSK